jgi:hypothetical protein
MVDYEITDEEDETSEESSIKHIVLSHIGKISKICCQELTEGYWQDKPIKTGGGVVITRTYHPDLKEAYCNAVDFLVDICYPLADKPFQDFMDIEEKKEEEKDKKEKLKQKRKTFKQLNIMFERKGFFESSEFADEK